MGWRFPRGADANAKIYTELKQPPHYPGCQVAILLITRRGGGGARGGRMLFAISYNLGEGFLLLYFLDRIEGRQPWLQENL